MFFIMQASTAVNLGFVVFIAGWIMQVVIIFGYPYTPDYYTDVLAGTVIFTLLPWYVPSSLLLDACHLNVHEASAKCGKAGCLAGDVTLH